MSNQQFFPDQTGFVPADQARVRLAATIVLLRDGDRGPEVFMMKRTSRVDFGGLHVFPGGKVDISDAHGTMAAHCSGLTDAEASARLGLESEGLAYWVAAIRECFEESGMLLAYGPDGAMLRARKPRWAAGMRALRDQLNAGERDFVDICSQLEMQLAADRVHYFSHWFTPEGPPRRYDTRFFVAAAPQEQEGLHDESELVDSEWVRPQDALDAYERGEFQMIYPTLTTLRALVHWDTTDSLLGAVQAGEHLPLVTPDGTLSREGLQSPPIAGS